MENTEDPNRKISAANFVIHETVNKTKEKCAKNIRLNFLNKKITLQHLNIDGLHFNEQCKNFLCNSIIRCQSVLKKNIVYANFS
jgi:hypothetical protein